jgi:hypothetical protein
MTTFDELQLNAKNISKRLLRAYAGYAGCATFFTMLIPGDDAMMNDAAIVAELAFSLDPQYDEDLNDYFEEVMEDLGVFKEQVLIGIYLLKWFKYNTNINSYWYGALLNLFRDDLKLSVLENIGQEKYKLCLDSLSKYCSYVFYNDKKGLNSTLIIKLDKKIQLDIYNASKMSFASAPSLYSDIYKGIICSIGIKG